MHRGGGFQAFGFDFPDWATFDEMPFPHATELTIDIIEKLGLIFVGFPQILIDYEELYLTSDITGFKC